jgi:hypothetical protein
MNSLGTTVLDLIVRNTLVVVVVVVAIRGTPGGF